MGLSQYLWVEEWTSAYSKVVEYPAALGKLRSLVDCADVASKVTRYKVGYWGKFWALHNYIVKHIGSQVDDCGEMVLAIDEVQSIIDTCTKVLENHDLANELFPISDEEVPSTYYDKYYFEDVEYTKLIFSEVLKVIEKDSNLTIIYEASW